MVDQRPYLISSKRDGYHFYLHQMDNKILDIRMPVKCENAKEIMKCLKDYFFIREGGEWKPSKLNGGVGFYIAY